MKKVLAIDDEQDITDIIRDTLDPFGFSVETRNSASEGIEIVKRGFKGLILLDISMPEMNGWKFVQTLAEQDLTSQVVICMLTAIPTPDSKQDPLAGYVLEYLRKPFTPDSLSKTVEKLSNLIPES